MKLSGLSLIGFGAAAPGGSVVHGVNPASGAGLDPGYHWATAADVDQAARLAAEGFREFGQWNRQRRAVLLRRMAELFEANAPELIQRAEQETALPLGRLQTETARTCGQLRFFASLIDEGSWLDARIDHGEPERKPLPKPDVRSVLVPLGPVAVFSSSNFPFAFSVAGGDTASALAAGCPVIVKAHQGHMGVSEMVGLLAQQAARECGAPEGVFSLLFGPGPEVGMALVKHPSIKAVGFTGSVGGGRALMDAAAARPVPIPVYAEMGSVNPVFLLPSAFQAHASAEALAAGLRTSATMVMGQLCTNPGLVFVTTGPSTEAFLRQLTALMNSAPSGTMLTASICRAYREGVERFRSMPGVRCLTAADSDEGVPDTLASPALLITTAGTFLNSPALMDEVFGPSTLIVECASTAEMLLAAEKLQGQLTASVHGTEAELVRNRDLVEMLKSKAGRLICNGFPTGVEVCHAMTHGGPYPATGDGRSTSVGSRAIHRFARPVSYQNFPDALLPQELQESNPLGIHRLTDGKFSG